VSDEFSAEDCDEQAGEGDVKGLQQLSQEDLSTDHFGVQAGAVNQTCLQQRLRQKSSAEDSDSDSIEENLHEDVLDESSVENPGMDVGVVDVKKLEKQMRGERLTEHSGSQASTTDEKDLQEDCFDDCPAEASKDLQQEPLHESSAEDSGMEATTVIAKDVQEQPVDSCSAEVSSTEAALVSVKDLQQLLIDECCAEDSARLVEPVKIKANPGPCVHASEHGSLNALNAVSPSDEPVVDAVSDNPKVVRRQVLLPSRKTVSITSGEISDEDQCLPHSSVATAQNTSTQSDNEEVSSDDEEDSLNGKSEILPCPPPRASSLSVGGARKGLTSYRSAEADAAHAHFRKSYWRARFAELPDRYEYFIQYGEAESASVARQWRSKVRRSWFE
jgi:hypothetical protein